MKVASWQKEIVGEVNLTDIIGIALAGRHSLILMGGKTGCYDVNKAIEPIVKAAPMCELERGYEVLGVYAKEGYSVKNLDDNDGQVYQPFVSPLWTFSLADFMGGWRNGKFHCGQMTLAHNGILYLENIERYRFLCLEQIKEVMKSRKITLHHDGKERSYPANFQLVATTYPCECGNHALGSQPCRCSKQGIIDWGERYSEYTSMFDIAMAVPADCHVANHDGGFNDYLLNEIRVKAKNALFTCYARYGKESARLTFQNFKEFMSDKEFNIVTEDEEVQELSEILSVGRLAVTIQHWENYATLQKEHWLYAKELHYGLKDFYPKG